MIQVKNLFNNDNVTILANDEKYGYKILQIEQDLSTMPWEAVQKYFAAKMNCKQRMAILELQGNEWTLSQGAMYWMAGQVMAKTGVKGVSDLFGKALKGAATSESMIKPVYSGMGKVALEPTYRHILPVKVADWGSLCMTDGTYLASTGVELKTEMVSNVTGAFAGSGLFHTRAYGDGVVLLESPCAEEELMVVEMNDDVFKLDGNCAVCWSGALKVTVERVTKTLIGSAASGEGLVNVYKGTGKILVRMTKENAKPPVILS